MNRCLFLFTTQGSRCFFLTEITHKGLLLFWIKPFIQYSIQENINCFYGQRMDKTI